MMKTVHEAILLYDSAVIKCMLVVVVEAVISF